MKVKKMKLILWTSVLTLALFGCQKRAVNSDEPTPQETDSKQVKVESPLYRDDAIQYVPDVSHAAYEEEYDCIFLNNVFLVDAGENSPELPNDLAGGHLKGFDLFTKCYLYELDGTYSAIDLLDLCSQASTELQNVTSVSVSCHPYGFYDFEFDTALTMDENMSKFAAYLSSEPKYKYGVYIPDESHVKTTSDGIEYVDNAIQVTIGTVNGEYEEVLGSSGGQISGCMCGTEKQYPDRRECGGDFIITFDSSKSYEELTTICGEMEQFGIQIPAEYDANGQVITAEKLVSVHNPKVLDYASYLDFYSYDTNAPITTNLD